MKVGDDVLILSFPTRNRIGTVVKVVRTACGGVNYLCEVSNFDYAYEQELIVVSPLILALYGAELT